MPSISDIENSIDLFSGQVRFPVNLALLPGRNGLDLNLNIYYDSQVLEQATYWNLSQPTGVLGLGWNLPNDGIYRLTDHSADNGASGFYLSASIGNTKLICTGVETNGEYTFAAENYAFWVIRYNAQVERWTIIVENGDTCTYGDSGSGRNTVQWGVNWGNWVDSSNETTGQSQIATIWNISQVSNRFDDTLTYSYTQAQKNAGTSSGLLFTQASYLMSIKNAQGQAVNFVYADKTPDEYQDPHSNPAAPNAYQDRFETKYLQEIDVLNSDGSVLYSQVFGYSATFLGSGNLTKRLLSSITRKSANGKSQPGTSYAYYSSADGVSAGSPYSAAKHALYGALKTVTFKEGGSATYQYTALTMGYSDRKETLNKPVKSGVSYSNPKFYFKRNYTLVTWLGSDNTFSLQAYFWDGRWLHKDLGNFTLTSGAYDTFAIELNDTYFAFYTDNKLYLFYQNAAKAGEWILPSVGDSGSKVSYFSPAFDSGSSRALACAYGFAAILGTYNGSLVLYQYSWNGVAWQAQNAVNVASVSSALFNITAVQNQVFICYWQAGFDPMVYQSRQDLDGSLKANSYTISGLNLSSLQSLNLYGGESFVTFAFVSAAGDKFQVQYGVFWCNLAQSRLYSAAWESGYYDSLNDVPVPQIDNSLVAIEQYAYRFNGKSWVSFDTSTIRYPGQTQVDMQQVGIDQFIRKITTSNSTPYIYDLLQFNPNTGNWGTTAQIEVSSADTNLLIAAARTEGSASVFALLANKLYTQAADGSWTAQFTIPDTLLAADLPTVQLLGENLLAYQINTGTVNQKTVIYLLKNGGLQNAANPIVLTGEQIYAGALTANGLVGDSSFVTYTGILGDAGSTLSLYRPITGAVSDKQTIYAVNVTVANNGYAQTTQINATFTNGVAYEAATGIVGGSGYAPQFNKATRIPGSTSTGSTPNGTTDFFFMNGIAPGFGETPSLAYPENPEQTNVLDYYSLIKGALYTMNVNAYTTGLTAVSEVVNYWWIETLALGLQGQGNYMRQRQQISQNEGVEQTVTQTFNSNTGLLSKVWKSNYNAKGETEHWVEEFVYFWEKYDTTRSLNILSPVVQTTTSTINLTTSTTTVTGIFITTWKEDWGAGQQWAPYLSYRALSGSAPVFDSWKTSDSPPSTGWLKSSSINRRNAYGLILEQSNVDEVKSSIIFDTANFLEIARCFNAGSGQFSYFDFEPYAANSGWSYTPSTTSIQSQITQSDFNTGTQCLLIAPKAGSKNGPIQIFTPSSPQESYVFGSWGKVETGFDSTKGKAQWEITFYNGSSAVGSPVLIDMSTSTGKWSYFQSTIDLAAIRTAAGLPSNTQLSIKIQAYNQNSATKNAWVDNLRFTPLKASFEASVYDPVRWRPTANVDINGQINQLVYNSFDEVVANIGPNERVISLAQQSYSRALSAADVFIPNYPNSVLKLGTSDTSQFYDFHNVETSDWTFSPGSDWSISTGQLKFSPAGATSGLGGTAVLSSFVRINFAARIEVQRATSGPLASVSIGNGYIYLRWKETGTSGSSAGQWELLEYNGLDPVNVLQINTLIDFREDWLFAVVDGYVICYVDGIQLFNYQYTPPSSLPAGYGKFTIAATQNCTFDNLILLQEPQLSVDFMDGLGNTLQTISLLGLDPAGSLYPGKQAITGSGVFLDALGRTQYSRNVLTAPLQLTSGSAGATKPELIEADQSTYLYNAEGNAESLENYLSGASGELDYSVQSFEASPLSRVTQVIAPRPQSSAAGNYTMSFAYSGIPGIPELNGSTTGTTNIYFQTASSAVQSISKTGVISTQTNYVVKDLLGNTIAQLGGTTGKLQKTQFLYDAFGNLEEVRMPNYFAPPALSVADTWKERNSYTFNKLLSQKVTPDSGTTQFAYDSANRLRFRMDANGSGLWPQRIVYYKYDVLGRKVEEGFIQSDSYAWGSDKLTGKLNTPEFPVTDPSRTSDPNYATGKWSRKYVYDTDGTSNTKYLIGRLFETSTNNGIAPDTESKTYDAYGNVLSVTTKISAQGSTAFTTSYEYNNQNQVAKITYPKIVAEDTAPIVAYTYDRLGRLVGVGKPTEGTEVVDPSNPPVPLQIFYAYYTYDFQGRLSLSRLNNQQLAHPTNPIDRNYSYSEEGYLTQISDAYFNETLGYNDGSGVDGMSYYNGMIASTAFSYKAGAQWAAPPTPYNYAFEYDSNDQLTKATNSLNNAWSLGIGTTATPAFDANGNMQNALRGVDAETYNYLVSGRTDIVNNQLANFVHTTAVSQDFEGVPSGTSSANGWTWGSNNGGPSNTAISTDNPHSGSQCLFIAGGSLAHYNLLSFPTYLNPTMNYSFSCWIRTGDGFSSAIGDAGWYLRIDEASGQIVEVLIASISSVSTWTNIQQAVDLPTILQNLGLKLTSISSVSLELRNYKRLSTPGTGPGIYVDDIVLNGTQTSAAYVYDARGNAIASPNPDLDSIAYDPLTNLTTTIQLDSATGNKVNYQYGAQNERTWENYTDSGGTAISSKLSLFGESSTPLVEKKSTESLSSYFIFGIDGMLATTQGDSLSYLLKDHLGSTRVLVDGSSGNVVNYYDYMPYGDLIRSGQGNGIMNRYTGQEFEPNTGLYNYNARLFDTNLKRFFAPDPAGQYPSPYSYVGNNPVNRVDPSGQWAFTIAAGTSMLIGGAFNVYENWDDPSWSNTFKYFVAGGVAGLPYYIFPVYTTAFATLAGAPYIAAGFIEGAAAGGINAFWLNGFNEWIRNDNISFFSAEALNKVKTGALRGSIINGVGALIGNAVGNYFVLSRDTTHATVRSIGRSDRYSLASIYRYFFEPRGAFLIGNDLSQGMRSTGLLAPAWSSGIATRSGYHPPIVLGFDQRWFDLEHLVPQRWFRGTMGVYFFNAPINLYPVNSYFNQVVLEAGIASWRGGAFTTSAYISRALARGTWLAVTAPFKTLGLPFLGYALYDYVRGDDPPNQIEN